MRTIEEEKVMDMFVRVCKGYVQAFIDKSDFIAERYKVENWVNGEIGGTYQFESINRSLTFDQIRAIIEKDTDKYAYSDWERMKGIADHSKIGLPVIPFMDYIRMTQSQRVQINEMYSRIDSIIGNLSEV